MKKCIVILGPTATNKSDIGIFLKEKLSFLEIISADSMQFYKEMDIGTAKVSLEVRSRIQHNLVDIITIEEEFSVADFKKECIKKMYEIYNVGKVPLIVGGSGLYIRAITENFPVDNSAPKDEVLRTKLSSMSLEELRNFAFRIDPEAVYRIGRGDRKRLIRVIEFYEKTGKKISEIKNIEPEIKFLKIGLMMERDKLYEKINDRVDKMFEEGFVEEVKNLRNTYRNWSKTALQAIGYKEILQYLDGKITLEEAKKEVKQRTRNFAKRQITWYKKEKDVIWFDVLDLNSAKERILKIVKEFINEN